MADDEAGDGHGGGGPALAGPAVEDDGGAVLVRVDLLQAADHTHDVVETLESREEILHCFQSGEMNMTPGKHYSVVVGGLFPL